jgi:hypothetical protein
MKVCQLWQLTERQAIIAEGADGLSLHNVGAWQYFGRASKRHSIVKKLITGFGAQLPTSIPASFA